MRLKRRVLWLAVVAVAVGALGITSFMIWSTPGDKPGERSPSSVASSLIDEATLAQLATTSVTIDRSHLASDLTPPTNKWFSGFALQAEPKPGYNYPNSFLPRGDGFEFSLPSVAASETAITGSHSPGAVVKIAGAASYKVTAYDELMVELTYYSSDNQPVAAVRVASGLPYVYVSALRSTALSFNGDARNEKTWTSINGNGMHYGVNKATSGNSLSLAENEHISFFSAPSERALKAVLKHAGAAVQSGTVSYERKGSNFMTTFTYATANNEPVLFARLPHQKINGSAEVRYQSVLGDLTTEVGTEFSFTTPVVPVTGKLDVSALSSEERDLLAQQLRSDVAEFEEKQDTYFGGKQLYRMAQLLMIAEQLGDKEASVAAKGVLKHELSSWLTLGKSTPKSFLYDSSMKGIVGNEASFGSDKEFNDHHFHYGYFIYAAAILAEFDSEFLAAHKSAVNLLVADIANYNPSEKLPLRRSFDPYAGHSWASGTAPFLDGNNQESTSEAINAWVGVALWAKRIDSPALTLEAEWMLSQEYQAAQIYWLLQQESTPEYLASYKSPIVSIVWGGKREYATFFSDEPNAKLAIQLLPLSPTIKALNRRLPEKVFEETSTNKIYGDSILMAQPDATLRQAISLPDSAIDDGNSRTYMYAYILSKS